MAIRLDKKVQKNLRSYLTTLVNSRKTGVVTADDAHRFLTRKGVREEQTRTRLAYINSVLNPFNFEADGETPSERPAARGRMITEWTL